MIDQDLEKFRVQSEQLINEIVLHRTNSINCAELRSENINLRNDIQNLRITRNGLEDTLKASRVINYGLVAVLTVVLIVWFVL